MDVKSYCANMRGEIEEWKSTINKHLLEADRRSADADEAIGAIHKINDRVSELEQTVDKLEKQCPADWSSERAQLDGILSEVKRLWQEATEGSPDDL
jgi:predicted nuclease with TOPRIM domain